MSSASTSCISSASTSTSSDWWCGGSGPVKWLTDVVAGGKWNDWLMQWYGNTLCLALALALSLALALTDDMVAVGKSNDWLMWWQWASQMTDWCGGRGQVKWLTDVVAGGKSNDWLMRWYGNTLCLVLALAVSLVQALVLALTDDVVAVGQSNDWLMWWQGASEMIDWCSDMVTLYV